MPVWDPDDINQRADHDFEAAWMETAKLVNREGKSSLRTGGKGQSHPMEDVRQRIRKVLIGLGFDEIITPIIWEDEHVRRQYGPESALILDRCYYLAGLPRPEIGLSKTKMRQIEKILPGFSAFDKLTALLRDYKSGKIESDDFVEEMIHRLDIPEEKATEIIDKVFSELRKLHPVPTKLTLLSHFTTAWFPILAETLAKKVEPVSLFTTGVRMRREQREDATHLRSHYNASIVIMSRDLTLEDGRSIVRKILGKLGFQNLDFVVKEATSNYYAPGTEEEVFADHPTLDLEGGVEVADLGMYSPVALARYGIPYPVFNMGLSIGRLAMISREVDDIRDLTYPEIYLPPQFSDDEIESALKPVASPRTGAGREISEGIIRVAKKRAETLAPCRFKAWKGKVRHRQVLVELVEEEENVKLVGPAGRNIISARDGNIVSQLPEKASRGGLSYMQCIADYCAAMIESRVAEGFRGTDQVRIGMVRSASDIFLEIPLAIRKYIESNNLKIDIRGPVFTTIEYTVA
jgi:O-phosphoseryl-tRNA synthetase